MNDDLPHRPPSRLTILPLDELGVEELTGYIEALQTEIVRAKATIAHKQHHLSAADQIFGKLKGAE